MPPTPLTLGAVVILITISMAAAATLGAITRGKAFAAVIVVAVVSFPLGYLGSMNEAAASEHKGAPGEIKGNPAHGEQLFRTLPCGSCHTITGISSGTIGPELTHVGTVGGTRKPPMAAADYIHESIATPQAFVAPGFPSPSAMPAGLASGSDLDDLVAFLAGKQ